MESIAEPGNWGQVGVDALASFWTGREEVESFELRVLALIDQRPCLEMRDVECDQREWVSEASEFRGCSC